MNKLKNALATILLLAILAIEIIAVYYMIKICF